MMRFLSCVSVSFSTVVIAVTAVDRRVEKDNRNSRNLQAVLDPSGYLQHQHGMQIDGPSLQPPSSLDSNAASSSASVSSSVPSASATDSITDRGKTRTSRRYSKHVSNKKEHDQTIAAGAEAAGRRKTNKMLGHVRRPWSAVQSVTDLPRKAARAVHSLVLARPTAFSSSETNTQDHETAGDATVNETCADAGFLSNPTDGDACTNACLNLYFKALGLSPDDVVGSGSDIWDEHENILQRADDADEMDSSGLDSSELRNICESHVFPVRDVRHSCPSAPIDFDQDTVFASDPLTHSTAICDNFVNGGFTIRAFICEPHAAAQSQGAADTCKNACLDFFSEWLSLSGDAELMDEHVMQSVIRLFANPNVTTEDYASDAYLNLTAFNVTRICSEGAIAAFDDYVNACPEAPQGAEDVDDEGRTNILKELVSSHHREVCEAQTQQDAGEAEGASVGVYLYVAAAVVVLGLVGGGAFVFVYQGSGGVEAMAGSDEGADGEAPKENGTSEEE